MWILFQRTCLKNKARLNYTMRLPSSYTDKELLLLLKNSNEKAFTAIYDRYSEKIFAIAYLHCKKKELAEEAMQDVFMSLWDRRTSLQIKTLPAYLATAAKFSVFEQLRKDFRRRQLLDTEIAISGTVSEEPTVYARFLKGYIKDIVDKLPEKCRLVYHYSREEGMKIEEIASTMKINNKSVENYLHRALKMLRLSLRSIRMWLLIIILLLYSQI